MLAKTSIKKFNKLVSLSRCSIVRSNVTFSGVKIQSQCETESQSYKVNFFIKALSLLYKNLNNFLQGKLFSNE
jgi:hypothetical protein